MAIQYLVGAPGKFDFNRVYLDLETVKVPCDTTGRGYHVIKTGEPLTKRWSVFMAGIGRESAEWIPDMEPHRGYGGVVEILELSSAGEEDLLSDIAKAVDTRQVLYRATRKFDEMILKGRYTYARRGPEPVPFYPAMPGAEDLTWICERPDPDGFAEKLRERELMSKGLYDLWRRDDAVHDLVLIHNLRDVVELILAYGGPDPECFAWCKRVLTSREFARYQIFGPVDD
jgi:hypothetical protein